ncbi:site-specific integrase [Thermococcus aciditolerans]|uniref:Tyrosine-type recombinase/integrase n=1 Tax=Thermococcus aciditolerans TaxID=2598455 RepID=A0A5C0SMA6_9EURY|nr:tyrosine-type recombinase/integrase [Thermococcus aciditolerans]QEK15460.1 tyrosine-type recombinase/integrase [Thermococcus aciditolerans]
MGWDMGLDYEETYKLLLRDLNDAKRKDGIKALKRRLYLIILLTQLRNGSRIGEAIEFISKVSREYSREALVTVEKRTDEYQRLMVLPKEIKKADLLTVKGILEEELQRHGRKGMVAKISTWVKKTYGFNTHSLRYAFVSYLAQKKYPPQIIAKITGHKRLDYILHYTQEKAAQELLVKLDLI